MKDYLIAVCRILFACIIMTSCVKKASPSFTSTAEPNKKVPQDTGFVSHSTQEEIQSKSNYAPIDQQLEDPNNQKVIKAKKKEQKMALKSGAKRPDIPKVKPIELHKKKSSWEIFYRVVFVVAGIAAIGIMWRLLFS